MRALITQAISDHASQQGDKPALIIGDQVMSYADLVQTLLHLATAVVDNAGDQPTFEPSGPVLDQALWGLARLQAGHALIGTTSGTTGMAKRYRRSQQSWIESFKADQIEFGLSCDDVIIAPGSLSHSLFSYALCQGLYRGATVVLSESFRPDRVLAQISRHSGTVLYGVPTQLKMLLRQAQIQSEGPMVSVRWALSSGARWFAEMAPQIQQLFPAAKIGEFYGASELSFVTLALHGWDSTLPVGSVGRPFHDVLIDAPAHGAIDKIWVHSAGLFENYLSEPPADFSERVDAQGRRWLSIGDLGWQDQNGYLFLVGRESRKIVTSGKNLYPEEVELLLMSHPAVQQAAIIGVPDALRGERLLALVQVQGPVNRSDLMAFLQTQADDYKIPREFRLLENWPYTASGKTDFVAIAQTPAQNLPLLN